MAAFTNFHMSPSLAGLPLSGALKKVLKGVSWNEVRRMIATRQVQVNGNLCVDESRRVSEQDVIKVWEHPLAKPVDERDVRIVFWDEHLVVVEKPAGVTTLRHAEERNWPARRKQMQPTLDELLPRVLAQKMGLASGPAARQTNREGKNGKPLRVQARGKERQSRQPRPPTVLAVHRLDRDTSGLMVFARTPTVEQSLVRLFSKHRIERSYWAVALGRVTPQTLDTLLVRDRGDGLRGSLPAGDAATDAQRAITHVRALETFIAGGQEYSVIECRLETGRTHQIRIHLAEIGHMLCGEKTYTHPLGGRPAKDPSAAPRQTLHAAELGFVHPVTGELLNFQSPPPAPDLRDWLKRLRETPGPAT